MTEAQLADTAVNLRTLVETIDGLRSRGSLDTPVLGLSLDSRATRLGDLFAALPGTRDDGRRHVAEALGKGAAAFLAEGEVETAGRPLLLVPDARKALAHVAAAFYGHPSRELALVGVTGTNGKSTTTHLIREIGAASGVGSGVIGTLGWATDAGHVPLAQTTPEAPTFQEILRKMADQGVRLVAAEISSHALAQWRVHGTRFRAVLFTNLTRDHLDYHKDMESYLEAKLRLFSREGRGDDAETVALVNVEDAAARHFLRVADGPVLTFGFTDGADVRGEILSLDPAGTRIRVHRGERAVGGARSLEIPLRLVGPFNARNALAAAACATALGIPDDAIVDGLGRATGISGRMERVERGQDFLVIVDYAHTPDALERILRAVREVARGKVIVVFGCGGDRDRGKRPIMGRIATTFSDRAFLTSDNPRSEDPETILDQIETGAREGTSPYVRQVDRSAAIHEAIAGAKAGDVVVIAGKGHETYQIFATRTIPFDDRVVAGEALAASGGKGR